MKVLSFAVLLAVSSVAGAAQVYKWTDESGRVHYSQTMPRNVSAQTLQIKTYSGYQPVAKPTQDSLTVEKPELNEDEQATKERQLKEQCLTLKDQMDTLASGNRVYEMQNDKRVYLTAEQITQKRVKIRDIMDTKCRGKL